MALNCCGKCDKPFTLADFPQDKDNLVFTVCQKFFLHIYHNKGDCLASWVQKSEKGCPTCRTVIYSHQLGKNIAQISRIFLASLTEDKETVLNELSNSAHKAEDCIICLETFPVVKIKFNPDNKRLHHESCDSNNLPYLTVHDLSKIVSKVVEKRPGLQKHFTPTPPTLLQRVQIDYPHLYKVAIVSAISIGAFILNRLQFDGKNSLLSVIGYPAYLTLYAAQKIFARFNQ